MRHVRYRGRDALGGQEVFNTMQLFATRRRKLAGTLAAGSAVALLMACAALAAGPKQNITTGSGDYGFAKVHINAHSDADTTTDARGRFTLEQPNAGVDVVGRVTCLRVVGNQSVAGGVITKSASGVPPVGSGFLQYTEDNGSPGELDRSQTVFLAIPPESCPNPITPAFELVSGNFVVKQAEEN